MYDILHYLAIAKIPNRSFSPPLVLCRESDMEENGTEYADVDNLSGLVQSYAVHRVEDGTGNGPLPSCTGLRGFGQISETIEAVRA